MRKGVGFMVSWRGQVLQSCPSFQRQSGVKDMVVDMTIEEGNRAGRLVAALKIFPETQETL
jgi:hypothetical protein